MQEPEHVADCVRAMRDAVDIPVTVKCRLGVDDQEPAFALNRFADAVYEAGASMLCVHARKAWLQGLSPKENRSVPPLDYSLVYDLKSRLSDWPMLINGGIADLDQANDHIPHMDGVMLGRAIMERPGLLTQVDGWIEGAGREPVLSVDQAKLMHALQAYGQHIEQAMQDGCGYGMLIKPVLGSFHGLPGAKRFRRTLSEQPPRTGHEARNRLELALQSIDVAKWRAA